MFLVIFGCSTLLNTEKKIIYLKEKNILLKNINLEIAIITFIAGILLSDPIKKLLKHWLICD